MRRRPDEIRLRNTLEALPAALREIIPQHRQPPGQAPGRPPARVKVQRENRQWTTGCRLGPAVAQGTQRRGHGHGRALEKGRLAAPAAHAVGGAVRVQLQRKVLLDVVESVRHAAQELVGPGGGVVLDDGGLALLQAVCLEGGLGVGRVVAQGRRVEPAGLEHGWSCRCRCRCRCRCGWLCWEGWSAAGGHGFPADLGRPDSRSGS